MGSNDSSLEFPCRFPIKVFGHGAGEFEQTVREIIAPHLAGNGDTQFSHNLSSGNRYVAVTATITAISQEQLDAIYEALSDDQRIIMAL